MFHGDEDDDATAGKPLVRHKGFVVAIDGDLATVRLTDDLGVEFVGRYPADELKAAGIADREAFILTTNENGNAVSFDVRPAPRPRRTAEQQAIVGRRIEE